MAAKMKVIDVGFIVKKVQFLYKEQGVMGPVRALGRKVYLYGVNTPVNYLMFFWANATGGIPRWFTFQGVQHGYFRQALNFSWRNERNVEIPIVLPYLRRAYNANARVLEVGDTIRQYSEFKTHDILDKYEYREGVMNIDIIDFKPKEQYDLIVSVSTIEHIGWDLPDERDPEKIPEALGLIRKWLAPKGIAVITVPVGCNKDLDKRMRENMDSLHFSQVYYLTRFSKDNQWRETTREEALSKVYGMPFDAANAIVVGIIEKKDPPSSFDSR